MQTAITNICSWIFYLKKKKEKKGKKENENVTIILSRESLILAILFSVILYLVDVRDTSYQHRHRPENGDAVPVCVVMFPVHSNLK